MYERKYGFKTGLLLSFVILMFLSFTIYGEKISCLPEVMRPYGLVVQNNSIYVVDGKIIKLFSLKDFKYIKNIGRVGQGPGELSFSPRIDVFDDFVFVNTWGKVLFFSKKGDYLREKRLTFPVKYFRHPILPVKNNYIGMNLDYREKIRHIDLFDKEFKVKTKIYSGELEEPLLPPRPGERAIKKDANAVMHCWNYLVYQDKVFIGDSKKGLYFSVYDSKGKMLYEIKNDIVKNEISKEFINEFWDRKKKSKSWQLEKTYTNYVFPEYFPAFVSFKVNQDKIYVYTYKQKDKKYQIIVMDLKGKIIKKSFCSPLTPSVGNFSNFYSIDQDKMYYLKENEKDEIWEIHSINV